MNNVEIIIGEGITEEYYFKSVRDVVYIKPLAKRIKPYNLKELEKAIKQYAGGGYTTIHCLIDMDNKVKKAETLSNYIKLKEKYHNKTISDGKKGVNCKVFFYESYPCTEAFFYYYFEYSTAEKTNEGLKSWLNNRCGYETSERYLSTHSLHKEFKKHGGCLKKAIEKVLKINVVELKTDPQLMGALGAAEYARQKGLAKEN